MHVHSAESIFDEPKTVTVNLLKSCDQEIE